MDEWIDQLSAALGEPPLAPSEVGAILRLARDVAHGVERKLAPLAAYAVGVHVGRQAATEPAREEAFRSSLAVARSLLPEQPEDQRAPVP